MEKNIHCWIYSLAFPTGGFYIGSSINIRHRISEHLSSCRSRMENQIKRGECPDMGEPMPCILDKVPNSERWYWESFYIDRCIKSGIKLYNIQKTIKKHTWGNLSL